MGVNERQGKTVKSLSRGEWGSGSVCESEEEDDKDEEENEDHDEVGMRDTDQESWVILEGHA